MLGEIIHVIEQKVKHDQSVLYLIKRRVVFTFKRVVSFWVPFTVFGVLMLASAVAGREFIGESNGFLIGLIGGLVAGIPIFFVVRKPIYNLLYE